MIGIYVRVSSREQAQEGYSIPAQKERLKAFCQAHGWKDYKFYIDPGMSAKDMDRPEIQKMKKDIREKKVTTVLVYRLDRLTRSVRDLYDFLEFLEEHECTFKSATEVYDTSNAMGRMFIGLIALLAQWERENLGERVKMGMHEKIMVEFEASGAQPYGYKIENKKRVIHEEEAKAVRLMIDLFYRYRSMLHVARELSRRNIPTRMGNNVWNHQSVRQVLRNPALDGTLVYDGKVQEDAFPGIITKEERKRLTKLLESQSIVRLKAPTRGLFSGMIKCPQCDATLVKSGENYRCNRCYEKDNKFMRVNEKFILEAFKKYISDFKLIPSEEFEQEEPDRDIRAEISRVENRRLKYQRMYADDFMTYEELQTHIKETNQELELLMKELENEAPEEIDYEIIKKFKWMLVEEFDSLTKEEAIDFMMLFVKEIRFERKVTKLDKNGNPNAYHYTVTKVVFNGL